MNDLVKGKAARRDMIMRWAQRVLSAVTTSAALVFTSMSEAAAATDLRSESFADLAAEMAPAVVSISTHRVIAISADNPAGASADRLKKNSQFSASLGSGFIVDPSGYVVTNSHVIADADETQIILSGGKSFSARLIGADDKTDLALLKGQAYNLLHCGV
jgi:serine protease Do